MIRKQVYVTAEDDAKLKRLAGQRRCSEAAVLRLAIDALIEEDDALVARLRQAGLLVERPSRRGPTPAETSEADRQLEGWFLTHPDADPRLTAAVLGEREERDAVLSGHVGAHKALRP